MTQPKPIISAYVIEAPPYFDTENIEIARTGKIVDNRHTLDVDVWAIRRAGRCLNTDLEWEYEPQPSSRDDEFYARCRFTLDKALEMAQCKMAEWIAENADRIAAHMEYLRREGLDKP